MSDRFWAGRSVFLSGHTGFKGGWLALWLASKGAQVHGFALAPPTEPSLFTIGRVEQCLASHQIGDIRDAETLAGAVRAARPDIVFHLAAQPLVRRSYAEPVATFATNVMGTLNMLEAVRASETVRAVVNVTTDKCYANNEWLWPYRECEALGGHDPYSASKAAAEIVTAAMRASFLAAGGVRVATARAGNVLGGGDWAEDRLLPDFFRSVAAGYPLDVRYPGSTRPWQHVLEPLAGYTILAERLASGAEGFDNAWNFGPADEDARPVDWLLRRLCAQMPGAEWRTTGAHKVHEAGYLKLDSSRARHLLGWLPRWNLDAALTATVDWHREWQAGGDMTAVCLGQIRAYENS